MDPDTVPVEIAVLDVQPARSGRLLAVASVAVVVGGVELTLHGVRAVRLADGNTAIEPPAYRDHAGRWQPAVILPEELARAIARDVLQAIGCIPHDSSGL